ncbi:MAG: efflux RND transporter periplasmic adaptor subunit, partial [Lentimicrobiaceae bacterium]|nr:efflux RND transporter periplasmic adaptor subunit [Lentimicrobiaceae bacterium]
DEADIGKIKMGQKVTFTVDAYQNATFEGEVKQIRLNPIVTQNVVTYTIIINSKNEKLQLMPGMTATVTIFTRQILNTLIVPIAATKFAPTADMLTKYYKQHKLGAVPDSLMTAINAANEKKANAADKQTKNPAGDKKTRTALMWVAQNNGNLQIQKVHIGALDGINVQILEGLHEGDVVVTDMREMTTEQKNNPATSPFAPGPRGGRMR